MNELCLKCPQAYNAVNGRYCKELEMYVDRWNGNRCDVPGNERMKQ